MKLTDKHITEIVKKSVNHALKEENNNATPNQPDKPQKEDRELPLDIVIMSHLSDAQELLGFDVTAANIEINFAKMLFLKYYDQNIIVKESELNEMWKEMVKRYNK